MQKRGGGFSIVAVLIALILSAFLASILSASGLRAAVRMFGSIRQSMTVVPIACPPSGTVETAGAGL